MNLYQEILKLPKVRINGHNITPLWKWLIGKRYTVYLLKFVVTLTLKRYSSKLIIGISAVIIIFAIGK